MEEKLQKAAMEGDTASLTLLIEQDPLILERRSAITTHRLETPLHVASMLGHVAFAAELLKRKPGLARELDATRSSALHLASAAGSVGIVAAVMKADPDACMVLDRDGRNPVHVAAMNGRMGSLKEMVKAGGSAAARAPVRRGGTVLHLCVEYSQLEALEFLVESGECRDLVNIGDRNGNTPLHLAVAHKQVEIVEFLLSLPGIDTEALNSDGMTATDILTQRKTDAKDSEIEESLSRAGAGQIHRNRHKSHNINKRLKKKKKVKKNEESGGGNGWMDRKRSGLMVVASLIATMAFQFAVTPPPSVWAEPAAFPPENRRDPIYYVRRAGSYLKRGERFYTINTASFVASLSVILLLMSGLPLNNRAALWLLLLTTWVAISGVALSYALAVIAATPEASDRYVYEMFAVMVFAWICLVSLLLVLHTIRLLVMMLKGIVRMIVLIVRCLSVRRRRPTPMPVGRV